jgi:SH3-like domain-containing protein
MNPLTRAVFVLTAALLLAPSAPLAEAQGHWRFTGVEVVPVEPRVPDDPRLDRETFTISPGGATHERQGGQYEVDYRVQARWDTPPGILIPGQEVTLGINLHVTNWQWSRFEYGWNSYIIIAAARRPFAEAEHVTEGEYWFHYEGGRVVGAQVGTRGEPRSVSESGSFDPVRGDARRGLDYLAIRVAGNREARVYYIYEWQPGPPDPDAPPPLVPGAEDTPPAPPVTAALDEPEPDAPPEATRPECHAIQRAGQIPNAYFRMPNLEAGGEGRDRLEHSLIGYHRSLNLIEEQLLTGLFDLAESNFGNLVRGEQVSVLARELREDGRRVDILIRGLPSDKAMARLRQAEQARRQSVEAFEELSVWRSSINDAAASGNRRFIRQVFVSAIRSLMSWSSLPEVRDIPAVFLTWYAEALDEAGDIKSLATEVSQLRHLQDLIGQSADALLERHRSLIEEVERLAPIRGLDARMRAYFASIDWACWSEGEAAARMTAGVVSLPATPSVSPPMTDPAQVSEPSAEPAPGPPLDDTPRAQPDAATAQMSAADPEAPTEAEPIAPPITSRPGASPALPQADPTSGDVGTQVQMMVLSTPEGRGSPLYAGPGTDHPVVLHVQEGDWIELQSSIGDWALVWHMDSDTEGWVPITALGLPDEPGAPPMVVIQAPGPGWVGLHPTPDASQQPIARLFSGMVVDLLERRSGWLQVMLMDGTTGWIAEGSALPFP